MVKTFEELKKNDTIYNISIFKTLSAVRKGNGKKAYSILKLDNALSAYPSSTIIGDDNVIDVRVDNLAVRIKCSTGKNGNSYIFYAALKSTSHIEKSFTGAYRIFATTKEECLETARNVVYALMEVNKNTMIETDKCYKKILSNLK